MPAPDFLARANDILLNTYDFWPVQFTHGKGCELFDTDGDAYLDMGAGIAVSALGHAHKSLVKTIKDQAAKSLTELCYVVSPQRLEAAEKMLASADGDFGQIFFCSTGAEAVEGALKTARKWSVETKGPDCTEIIYFRDSFHGRTMGALSVIGQQHYRDGFEPLLAGTHEAVFNDIASVGKLISDKTAAVIIEPVLGEGGIRPATHGFLKSLRASCDKHGTALIFDEVQCGMGRTGHIHAYQHYGVVPDLITWAKGLGGGFPVGAFAGKKEMTQHITRGSHGSTYGGNPLACAVVSTVLDEISADGFMDDVKAKGKMLQQGLQKIADSTGALEDVRGLGLMQAARVIKGEAKALVKACLKEKLIILSCGNNSLRVVPPLIISEAEIARGLGILEKVIRAS